MGQAQMGSRNVQHFEAFDSSAEVFRISKGSNRQEPTGVNGATTPTAKPRSQEMHRTVTALAKLLSPMKKGDLLRETRMNGAVRHWKAMTILPIASPPLISIIYIYVPLSLLKPGQRIKVKGKRQKQESPVVLTGLSFFD